VVWKHGGRVFACDAGEVRQEDPHDPMRTAMRQVLGVWEQLERGTTAARMQAGRRRKAARGGFAYGAPPYGNARCTVSWSTTPPSSGWSRVSGSCTPLG
jgi:DNA invertase Pin-like site-specific DNA recombinase